MHLAEALAAIESAPPGPTVGAFFDFDGTLIDGYSAVPYITDRLRHGAMGLDEMADVVRFAMRRHMDEREFAQVLDHSLAVWRGHAESEVAALWLRLFREKIAARLYPEAWSLVKAHQRRGHTVVIASSALDYQVAPTADELGITDRLCTRAEVREGCLTGAVVGTPLWGRGKADAVAAFAASRGIALDQSHAYANGGEDVAFLKVVGHARAVNPQPALRLVAADAGWPMLLFEPRAHASPAALARSLGAYSTLAATALGGLAWGITTGRRRAAAETATRVSSEAVLGLGGIEVEVQGEANLWAHRPAVFLFNHQSSLDAYVLFSLLKHGVTAVAKKEMAHAPLVGPLLQALDFAFIDRGNTPNAIASLQPAVDRLRNGLSVVVAPEGTRSHSPRLGRFRKGAFHLAMQSGVPLVPIVLHNTYEMMPRGSMLLRPGTVRVSVLPPLPVSDWTINTLDDHVAGIQALFQRTLDSPAG